MWDPAATKFGVFKMFLHQRNMLSLYNKNTKKAKLMHQKKIYHFDDLIDPDVGLTTTEFETWFNELHQVD